MATTINISLDEEYIRKLDKIAEKTYRKRSELIRKWIDENEVKKTDE
ncbi:unnamed protein product [marine sediment metagenome]|uniref:Ribbon-helix-helix protein CopG domain-containing protein n=1 Tax=marine sediment metagenome TaxID=412755 RepID=X1K2D8_9ZZZZ